MARRFFGYGQKVVGSANGVVTVRPSGFGEPVEVFGPGAGASEFGTGSQTQQIPFKQFTPAQLALAANLSMVAPATRAIPVPFTVGAQMDPNLLNIGGGGTPGGTPGTEQQMYQCPDQMLVTDPKLCVDQSSMKKYLVPAAIVVGAFILYKML
jgi:hypothetical protein